MQPKIIVAVLDSLSATKDVAVTHAWSLAQWYESDLHVAYVGPSGRVSEGRGGAIRDDIADYLTRSGAVGANIVPAALSGSPVRAIASYVERISADLVVVGQHARPGSGYLSAGSFAAALGKAHTSPTIAIPSGHRPATAPGAPFQDILVAIDFSEVSLRALTEALVLAQHSGGRLRLLHVIDGFPGETVYSGSRAFRLMDDFRARMARVDRELRSLIPADASNWSQIEVASVSGLAHEAIVAAASEQRTDLVVLGLPRRWRMKEFLAGSTVHRILRRAPSPVLLVPGPATASQVRPAEAGDVHFKSGPGAFGVRADIRPDLARQGGRSWQ